MALTTRESTPFNIAQRTCDFLRLPAEVRETIYHYHLTSRRILPRHQFLAKRWTPINLLYVCRTIYHEAFYHLYTKGEFVLAVRPESIFGLGTCWGMNDVSASVGSELFLKSEGILRIVRHIALDIHWPSIEYSILMDGGLSQRTLTMEEMLKQTMAVVGTMLSPLPGLRIIDVSWLQMKLRVRESEEIAPPTYNIPGWLRGLKQVRRKNDRVLIRMPLKGPISTEQLSRDQEDKGPLTNFIRETREDMERLKAFLSEVGH